MRCLVCMACGKHIIVSDNPQNLTKSVELLDHYLMEKALLCIESYNGKSGSKGKSESSHI